MAATERRTHSGFAGFGSIVLAACALPGVLASTAALAEEAPERGVIGFTLSSYREQQDGSSSSATASSSTSTSKTAAAATVSAASGGSSGGSTGGGSSGSTSSTSGASRTVDRVHVTSPSLYALVPLGRRWAIEGSGTVDRVSGASPTYYTDEASMASFRDTRRALDGKLTRYFDRQSVALGLSQSRESDYISRALSLESKFASADQNTTFNVGLGLTRDTINPSNGLVVDAHKRINEVQFGVTQALSVRDLVQLTLSHSAQSGYLNDPYKSYDHRPDSRSANVAMLRWNHWLGGATLGGAALKTSYRYYRDDWGVQSHTLEGALALPVSRDGRSTLTPELRWYTQSAANFYVPVNTGSSTYPTPADTSGYTTLDQRLAAWGAITLGVKLDVALDNDWSLSTKFSGYRQQASYRWIGEGSTGLAGLTAYFWQVGLRRAF